MATEVLQVAAKALIIDGDGRLLLVRESRRAANTQSGLYGIVGGRLEPGESFFDALHREVKEETGLDVTACRLVYGEEHPEPYNHQYIFLCEVAPHGDVAIQDASEEALMNRININTHQPLWVETSSFAGLPFLTIALQTAIVTALKKGFPQEPVRL